MKLALSILPWRKASRENKNPQICDQKFSTIACIYINYCHIWNQQRVCQNEKLCAKKKLNLGIFRLKLGKKGRICNQHPRISQMSIFNQFSEFWYKVHFFCRSRVHFFWSVRDRIQKQNKSHQILFYWHHFALRKGIFYWNCKYSSCHLKVFQKVPVPNKTKGISVQISH